MWPQLDVVIGGELGHPGKVALDDLFVDHRDRCDDVRGRSENALEVHWLAPCHVSQTAINWKTIKRVAIAAFDRVRGDQSVESRLLGGFGHGVEDLVER